MKILIPTSGSRGDVQPFIALAQGLTQAGHIPTLASHPIMRSLVESHGVTFAPIGPDIDLAREVAAIRHQARNPAIGLIKGMRFGFEMLERSHADILALGQEADLVVAAEIAIGRVAVDDKGREAAGIVVQAARSVTRVDRLEAAAVLALDEARTARVGSMVEGVIVAARAEVGDSVRKDAVLGEIISERVHEAWADYRKAVAERRRLTGELEFAAQSERRALRLFDSKAISSQEVQRTQANRAAPEELLDMAQTEVRRAEEALEHLGITNAEDPSGESGELIPVRAPLSGIVLERRWRATPRTC